MLRKTVIKASLIAMLISVMSGTSKSEAYQDICGAEAHEWCSFEQTWEGYVPCYYSVYITCKGWAPWQN
jgi:hypothetical protein